MSPLLWAGLAVAVPLAAWWLWCLRPSQWREINKRIDAANARAEAKIRADELKRWQDQALDVVAEQRQPTQESGMHEHMRDAAGYCQTCDAGPRSDLPEPNLDVVAEPDHRRAEHMNRTLRRVEGGDEQVVDALRFIGKRHGGKGDPLTSTCACLQGKPCLCPCHRSNLTRDQHGGTA